MPHRKYVTPALIAAGALAAATLALNALIQAPTPAQAARQPFADPLPLAQVPPKPSPAPVAPGKPERRFDAEQARQRQQELVNALAAKLGVTPEKLIEATKQVRIDQVNKLVQEAKITREQADKLIQRINSSPGIGLGVHGPGFERGGPPGGPGALQALRRPGLLAAAQVLGVAPQDIVQALTSGQSLAEYAQSKGVSRDQLKTRMTDAYKAVLDAAVARGEMPADRAKQVLDRFAANLDRLVDAKPGQRRSP